MLPLNNLLEPMYAIEFGGLGQLLEGPQELPARHYNASSSLNSITAAI